MGPFVLRAIILYCVSLFVTLSVPSLFFVEEYVRTHDGCVAIAGAVVMFFVVPGAIIGWAIHVVATAVFVWSRHQRIAGPRGVVVDAVAGAVIGLVLGFAALSLVLGYSSWSLPGPEDEVFYVDLGGLVLCWLLGALTGWRLGVAARKAALAPL